MTPEERDRLAKAEQAIVDMRDDIKATRKDCERLLRALHMGSGAFFAMLRLGALLAAIGGVTAWLYDHLR
jgi:hypothetical protein